MTPEPDDLVQNAVLYAALRPVFGCGKKPEACLVAAIRRGIENESELTPLPAEQRYKLPGWHPGGVDLSVDLPQGGRVLMEMKVDHPDEALWDAIKLADIAATRPSPPVAAAYLVYAASADLWATAPEAAFFEEAREWQAQQLIARWPAAWANLLVGGRGVRPATSVSRLGAAPRPEAELVHSSGVDIRVLRVTPGSDPDPERYDEDGWPIGYDPPADLREKVHRADRERLAGAEAEVEKDPCHGYPWYRSWTRARLKAVVPGLDEDAFRCLRSRLASERGWAENEQDLGWVDALRVGRGFYRR